MARFEIGKHVIFTDYVYPPIPIRDFDWAATDINYDGADDSNCPVGRGPTEQAAITDLIDQLGEDEE